MDQNSFWTPENARQAARWQPNRDGQNYVCPFRPGMNSYSRLGRVRPRPDGRYEWWRYKPATGLGEIPGWAVNGQDQGVASSEEEARGLVEAGWAETSAPTT